MKLQSSSGKKIRFVASPLKATLIMFAVLASQSARARTTPCEMIESVQSIAGKFSQAQIEEYKVKLQSECSLSRQYRDLATRASRDHSISLERITGYQALRYVNRSWYEGAKAANTPVNKIYQLKDGDYKLDMALRPTIVWDNWMNGMKQFEPILVELNRGLQIRPELLLQIHKKFYELSEERGDYNNAPYPGQFKPARENRNREWFKIKDSEGESAIRAVTSNEAEYEALGLRATIDNYEDPYSNSIVSINIVNGVYTAYSGDERANPIALKNLLEFTNSMLAQGLNGRPMIWRGRLMTPGQVAYLVQQTFVGIHPFAEGNGRVSRFLQDLILAAFGLPYGPSGDLMSNDVLITHSDYYNKAMRDSANQMGMIEKCLASYRDQAQPKTREKTRWATRIVMRGEADYEERYLITESEAIPLDPLAYDCQLLN